MFNGCLILKWLTEVGFAEGDQVSGVLDRQDTVLPQVPGPFVRHVSPRRWLDVASLLPGRSSSGLRGISQPRRRLWV